MKSPACSGMCWRIRDFANEMPWRLRVLVKATAGQRVRLLVVVEESGSRPAHTKARSPAGDSRSFDSTYYIIDLSLESLDATPSSWSSFKTHMSYVVLSFTTAKVVSTSLYEKCEVQGFSFFEAISLRLLCSCMRRLSLFTNYDSVKSVFANATAIL
jgi:hypothetical protein